MPLTDLEIAHEVESGRLRIRPYNRDLLQVASIDLELGPKLLIPKPELTHVDLGAEKDISHFYTSYHMDWENGEEIPAPEQPELAGLYDRKKHGRGGYWLDPGEFVLGATIQEVSLSSTLCAHLAGRSTLGRVGILVHVTAGFVDPGFSGCITLEIKNVANYSILLRPYIRIGQLLIERLNSSPARVYGAPELRSGYTGANDGPVAPNLERKL